MLCTTIVQNFRPFGPWTACTFQFKVCTLILFKIEHDFVYIFLTRANQNKLTSFSQVLYPCHWSIKGGFPAKIDQSLVFSLCYTVVDELTDINMYSYVEVDWTRLHQYLKILYFGAQIEGGCGHLVFSSLQGGMENFYKQLKGNRCFSIYASN